MMINPILKMRVCAHAHVNDASQQIHPIVRVRIEKRIEEKKGFRRSMLLQVYAKSISPKNER